MRETVDGRRQEDQAVPPRALALSFASLAVAGFAAVVWPAALEEMSGLVWLLALVPAFLFAYFRGWEGAAAGVLIAMVLMIAIEIAPALVTGYLCVSSQLV